MKEQAATPRYKRHRFPPEIIGYAAWLYFRFALRYRDVEELLAERGVIVTYETIRQWCQTVVPEVWPALRQCAASPSAAPWRHVAPGRGLRPDNGVQHCLWRAVDQDGHVLDILVQAWRFKRPGHAQRFLAADGPVAAHCRPHSHRLTAAYRQTRIACCATWPAVIGSPVLA